MLKYNKYYYIINIIYYTINIIILLIYTIYSIFCSIISTVQEIKVRVFLGVRCFELLRLKERNKKFSYPTRVRCHTLSIKS